jgi:hypothetical protein
VVETTAEDKMTIPEADKVAIPEPTDQWVHRSAAGYRIATPEPTDHPGEPHEFTTVCSRCGENGYLNVAIITDLEVVKVEAKT